MFTINASPYLSSFGQFIVLNEANFFSTRGPSKSKWPPASTCLIKLKNESCSKRFLCLISTFPNIYMVRKMNVPFGRCLSNMSTPFSFVFPSKCLIFSCPNSCRFLTWQVGIRTQMLESKWEVACLSVIMSCLQNSWLLFLNKQSIINNNHAMQLTIVKVDLR